MSVPARWHRVIGSSLGLAEAPRKPRRETLASCIACLDTVLEVFPKDVDPVDDEPGYAMRSFAKAMRRRLEELNEGEEEKAT